VGALFLRPPGSEDRFLGAATAALSSQARESGPEAPAKRMKAEKEKASKPS